MKNGKKMLSMAVVLMMSAGLFASTLSVQAEAASNLVVPGTTTITASSFLQGGCEPTRLIDGDEATDWVSGWRNVNITDKQEWFTIDLKTLKNVSKVDLNRKLNPDVVGFPTDFQILYSVDGALWKTAKTIAGYSLTAADPAWRPFILDTPVIARYIKIEILKTMKNGGAFLCDLNEVRIMGTAYAGETVFVPEKLTYTAVGTEVDPANPRIGYLNDGNYDASDWAAAIADITSSSSTENLVFNLGSQKNIGALQLFPKILTDDNTLRAVSFPVDFKFQSSTNNTEWTDIPGQTYTSFTAIPQLMNFNFAQSVTAQYIRMVITKKGEAWDSAAGSKKYSISICEAEIYSGKQPPVSPTDPEPTDAAFAPVLLPAGFTVSSELTPASPTAGKLNDGNIGNESWTAQLGDVNATSCSEWVKIDLNAGKTVGSIKVASRRVGGKVYNFPADFKFQSSTDGESWSDIPGMAFTDYATPTSDWVTFPFNKSINTRYLRMNITKKGVNPDSNEHLVELSEIQVMSGDPANLDESAGSGSVFIPVAVPVISVTGSSSLQNTPSAATAMATDGNAGTFWCSEWIDEKNPIHTEWLSFDFGSSQLVGTMYITPRTVNGHVFAFPASFKLQYSNNGSTWSDISGQSYTDYAAASSDAQKFTFKNTVNARYIRIYITKRSADDGGNYIVEISEVTFMSGQKSAATENPQTSDPASIWGLAAWMIAACSTVFVAKKCKRQN